MELVEGAEQLAVCRLPASTPWPAPPGDGSFFSLTRDGAELTLVCETRAAPRGAEVVAGWRSLRVVGPLDFAVVGVLASLTGTLADAGVSVYAVSTFDTDHLLVREVDLAAAVDALEAAGHRLVRARPGR
jgi:uncharacterized protein